MKTQKKGRLAEEKALTYLIDQGLKPVSQNYTCRLGEIDLIMRDKEYWVFVEVRSRISAAYGDGATSITYAKRQKIIKSAVHYMIAHKRFNTFPMRFDVVSIDGKSASIDWLQDAFGMDY